MQDVTKLNIEVVKDLFDAHNQKDIKRIRHHLADDFSYKSPSSSFDNPDDFIAALAPMLELLKETKITKIVANGNEVVAQQIATMNKEVDGINAIEAIEWYTIIDGKVKSLLFLHDQGAISKSKSAINGGAAVDIDKEQDASFEVDNKKWQETSVEKDLAVA